MNTTEDKQKQAYRVGVVTLILLVTMTIGEYYIGIVAYQWWAILLGIAALKAFYVIRDYMHIGRLFSGEEETH